MTSNQDPRDPIDHPLPSDAHPAGLYAVPEPEQPRPATRIEASTTEDVLAYIQCTLGFQPANSLVIVAFAGNQLSTVVRCDLPEAPQNMLRTDTPESVTFMDVGVTERQELLFIDLGRRIGELLAKEPSTTQCLLLYLPDIVSVSDQHALAVVGTANSMITPQLGIQHVPVDESWLIHHHKVWHLRCAATTACTTQGDSLGDITDTDLYAVLSAQAPEEHAASTPPEDLVFAPGVSSADPSRKTGRHHSAAMLDELCAARPQLVVDWLQLWDQYLSAGPSMMHSTEVAQLLAAVEIPSVRDAIIAAACFDVPTAVRGMVAIQKFPQIVAQRSGLSHSNRDGMDVHNCLIGQSVRTPHWGRIAALERLCQQLLPLADNASGGAIAGMRVWIEWVRGRGSIALRYAEQARQHFPEDQLLKRLAGLLYQGTVAHWATCVESAWRPQHVA